MFRKIGNVLLICIFVVGMLGCGEKKGANQASVDDLSFLMTEHPELKTASLKKIKAAGSATASGTKTVHKQQRMLGKSNRTFALTTVEFREASDESGDEPKDADAENAGNAADSSSAKNVEDGDKAEAGELDPEVAKKAQQLIDKILDDFDFQAEVEMGFKLMGITINEQTKMLEEFKNFKNPKSMDKFGGIEGGKDFSKDKKKSSNGGMFKEEGGMSPVFNEHTEMFGRGELDNGDPFAMGGTSSDFGHNEKTTNSNIDDKFKEEDAKKIITCEEFVNNPFMKIAKREITRVIRANKKQIKKSLSGCAEILGGQFLQCVNDFNKAIKLLNETASCDIEDFDELERRLDEKTDGKYEELNESVENCMSDQFAKCGFQQERVQKSGHQTQPSPSGQRVEGDA